MRDYLVSRGVTADRLRTVSYGEERPKYDNTREETRRLNRRAALTVNLTIAKVRADGDGISVLSPLPTHALHPPLPVGYFILVVGAGLALWQAGVLARVARSGS